MSIRIGVQLRIAGGTAAFSFTPEEAPSSLIVSTYNSDQINMIWTRNSSMEDGFAIERSTDGINYIQIGTVGAGVTIYSAIGLTANTLYYFRVRAYRGSVYSNYSNVDSGTTYLTETGALIARFTGTPTEATKALYNTTIVALIAAGTWAKRDAIWLFGGFDLQASLLNLKTGSFGTATRHGTANPTHTPGGYIRTDGIDNYLNLHFNPVVNGTQFQKDGNSFGARVGGGSSDNDYGMGARTTTPASTYNVIKFKDATYAAINHCTTTVNYSVIYRNLIVSERPDAANQRLVLNGAPEAPQANASTNPVGYDFFLGSYNLIGNPSGFVALNWYYAMAGANLSAGEHAAEYAALEYFVANIAGTL